MEHTQRPDVICHMTTSLDGKVTGMLTPQVSGAAL